jgi:hypothetical protein
MSRIKQVARRATIAALRLTEKAVWPVRLRIILRSSWIRSGRWVLLSEPTVTHLWGFLWAHERTEVPRDLRPPKAYLVAPGEQNYEDAHRWSLAKRITRAAIGARPIRITPGKQRLAAELVLAKTTGVLLLSPSQGLAARCERSFMSSRSRIALRTEASAWLGQRDTLHASGQFVIEPYFSAGAGFQLSDDGFTSRFVDLLKFHQEQVSRNRGDIRKIDITPIIRDAFGRSSGQSNLSTKLNNRHLSRVLQSTPHHLMHREIRRRNTMIGESGELRLIDWEAHSTAFSPVWTILAAGVVELPGSFPPAWYPYTEFLAREMLAPSGEELLWADIAALLALHHLLPFVLISAGDPATARTDFPYRSIRKTDKHRVAAQCAAYYEKLLQLEGTPL